MCCDCATSVARQLARRQPREDITGSRREATTFSPNGARAQGRLPASGLGTQRGIHRRLIVLRGTRIEWYKDDKQAAGAKPLNALPLIGHATMVEQRSDGRLSIKTDGVELLLSESGDGGASNSLSEWARAVRTQVDALREETLISMHPPPARERPLPNPEPLLLVRLEPPRRTMPIYAARRPAAHDSPSSQI